VNPRGYNLLAYTFGIDGARDAVGTGNVNFDALSSVVLHLEFNAAGNGSVAQDTISGGFIVPLPTGTNSDFTNYYVAQETMVVDTYSFTANFTTLENGNWTKQLAQ
jgi:hypothetical protein